MPFSVFQHGIALFYLRLVKITDTRLLEQISPPHATKKMTAYTACFYKMIPEWPITALVFTKDR